MTTKVDDKKLLALKIAFTYMPKLIDVTKYEYGDRHQAVQEHINIVREVLLINGEDPDEVYGEIDPDNTPNSSY